jgi:hypothetical protein
MGSLFSGPKSPPPPPPLPVLETPDPEVEKRKSRVDAIERRRKGRAGTIRTSPRGILNSEANGKKLLGE